ncbi:MAG TPA: isoaspartyl peptidase/L-asparaginase [Burkholderiales bacterium]|nr:isoaspartyl peptidase/L-asparaginase [Burkholderiales bacterium]
MALAIHGGAGTMPRDRMTEERASPYRAALEGALRAGYEVLERDGTSLDAVTAAVSVLEDSPLFNAGRGAVFNAAGKHELDAAVMEGAGLRAGAVAGVRRVRNPVLAARAVMERTPHVMLIGSAADAFARNAGLEMVAPDYYSTPQRLAALKRAQGQDAEARARMTEADRHGTVGAVALDRTGNVAAATSTGGFTNKLPGRVGDSPVIGAGTYADNRACAVSGTGDGEYYIRRALAYDITARMRYLGESLDKAAESALEALVQLGGSGGLVAIDVHGNIAMPFTTEGMYRGCVKDGEFSVAIFR